jgi:shikimate kinase
MGSGKSTLAAAVGELAGLPVEDLDALIGARAGCDVPELFRRYGERGFRELERQALDAVLAVDGPRVIALGGGTVVDEDSRRRLLRGGILITLHAPLAELVRRVGRGTDRPLLSGEAIDARLAGLLEARAGDYAECHARSDTGARALTDIAREVLDVARDNPIVVPLGLRSYRVESGAGIRSRLR